MMVKGTEQALSVCLSPQETGCLTFPFRQRRSWALPGAVSSLPGAQPWAECVHEPDSQRQPAVLVPAPAVPPPAGRSHYTSAVGGVGGVDLAGSLRPLRGVCPQQ